MAVALEEVDSRELARQCKGDIARGSCLMEKNGNLTYGQPNLISMDHEPAQARGKKRSPASPDSSNGFIPQLIEELFRLNQGKHGSITPHVQKEGQCFDSPLCRCLTRKGWQS